MGGPQGQLPPVGQLQFAQDPRDVRLHGLDGDEELGGDFLVCVATSDQLHHLAFPGGEHVHADVFEIVLVLVEEGWRCPGGPSPPVLA